jgi:hypothetical protein
MPVNFFEYLKWIRFRCRREACGRFAQRNHAFQLSRPIISFTFDDFPQNAGTTGRKILKQFGVLATYYVSFGLAGSVAPTGQIFESSELEEVIADGHELGCHTFDHCHAWDTDSRAFAESSDRNRAELEKLLPGQKFQTMSYPISCPSPSVKRVSASRFAACRGGGQTFNARSLDRNYLHAFFLEKCRDNRGLVRSIIQQNDDENGWLIFATHDISESPTPYGCSPEFFETTLKAAASSRAILLPVHAALTRVLNG